MAKGRWAGLAVLAVLVSISFAAIPPTSDSYQLTWTNNDISKAVVDIRDVLTADLDNDGWVDVISVASYNDQVTWYRNLGNGTFGPQRLVGVIHAAFQGAVGDFDHDGWVDVAAGSTNDDSLVWFRNTGGGNFSAGIIVSTVHDEVRGLLAEDLDNDGFLDLVVSDYGNDRIVWYPNAHGAFNASSVQILPGLCDGPRQLAAGDLNGDGWLDIVAPCINEGRVLWWPSQGNGSFSSWQLIVQGLDKAQAVSVRDVDGDSAVDVVVGGDNSALFVQNRLASGHGFSTNLTIRLHDVRQIILEDFTQSGAPDMLFITGNEFFTWFLNLGNASFSSPLQISTGDLNSIAALDVDGDGWLDLVHASRRTTGLVWRRNAGSTDTVYTRRLFGEERTIFESDMDRPGPCATADFDQDGLVDALVASSVDGTVLWYKNLNNGSFGSARLVQESRGSGVAIVDTCDLNEDGLVDVLTASPTLSTLAWLSNLGNGRFSSPITIDSGASQICAMNVLDWNGDDHLDLLTAECGDGSVGWYRGFGNGSFGIRAVLHSANAAVSTIALAVGDIDQDSHRDLMVSDTSHAIVWCLRGLGQGAVAPAQALVAAGGPILYLDVADMDGDDLLDLVVGTLDYTISWFRNSLDAAWDHHGVILQGTTVSVVRGFWLQDIDMDGRVDVVAALSTTLRIVWLRNEGEDSFSTMLPISLLDRGASDVAFADINNDGRLDLVSTSAERSTLLWNPNFLLVREMWHSRPSSRPTAAHVMVAVQRLSSVPALTGHASNPMASVAWEEQAESEL
ncbi:uncharacterized protein MONBRDRAFT_7129 [Monosiga brevicollis MX1]|uniref:VCBS repeat-containing protein n=1 Tax=Monosiga brevicollis TaxID=81824 RepID=A9UW07_MONBE|nr:uncharacterized protein MONBRDRAFT_7129 [Monosiga brevicollis MX1]EDQ90685.1 predicted protein [Monosiga brevicollis MX1]|eukprot:XP_001744736.1 hypothetical protein [Monosiga brevicollis MX1]